MKLFKSLTLAFMLACVSGFLVSCSGSKADSNEETSTASHGEGSEFNSAYVCPMHCEGSGSDKPGECPVCGMDYIAQSEHAEDGHSH